MIAKKEEEGITEYEWAGERKKGKLKEEKRASEFKVKKKLNKNKKGKRGTTNTKLEKGKNSTDKKNTYWIHG